MFCHFYYRIFFTVQVSEDCKYLQTTVTIDIGREKFTCSGKTLTSAGYTQAMTWQGFGTDEKLPDISSGDVCVVDDVGTHGLHSVCLI